MSAVDDAVAGYRAALDEIGEDVVLRRVAGAMQTVVATVTVRGRVSGYEPAEMVGGVQQGDLRVVILAEDVGSFPVPIEAGGRDRIVIGGEVFGIYAVDGRRRSVAGVLVAYELRVRGNA